MDRGQNNEEDDEDEERTWTSTKRTRTFVCRHSWRRHLLSPFLSIWHGFQVCEHLGHCKSCDMRCLDVGVHSEFRVLPSRLSSEMFPKAGASLRKPLRVSCEGCRRSVLVLRGASPALPFPSPQGHPLFGRAPIPSERTRASSAELSPPPGPPPSLAPARHPPSVRSRRSPSSERPPLGPRAPGRALPGDCPCSAEPGTLATLKVEDRARQARARDAGALGPSTPLKLARTNLKLAQTSWDESRATPVKHRSKLCMWFSSRFPWLPLLEPWDSRLGRGILCREPAARAILCELGARRWPLGPNTGRSHRPAALLEVGRCARACACARLRVRAPARARIASARLSARQCRHGGVTWLVRRFREGSCGL